MFCRCVGLLFVFVAMLVCGCVSERNSVIPIVHDIGMDVSTKYRYCLSCVYKGETVETIDVNNDFLARYHPRVFSAGGLPIVLRIKFYKFDTPNSWMILLSMCSLSVIPSLHQMDSTFKCSVELADEKDGAAPFELMSISETAGSVLSPTAFLFYNGDKHVDGRRVFSKSTQGIKMENQIVNRFDPETLVKSDIQFRQALSYAIAVKLKELEDSGKIDAMLNQRAAQRSVAPPHNVARFDRDQGGGYSFVIDMAQNPTDVDAAVKAVLIEFEKSVKEEYLDAFPNVDSASLSVAFSNVKVDGLRISGRAVPMSLKPLSLSYDAITRCGKLSVRFNAGQMKEARAWIRKNIKTLARDKNIALVTGNPPPEATYYPLVGEKIEGNVLEIEFKTE